MPWILGRWRSPRDAPRSLNFEKRRGRALAIAVELSSRGLGQQTMPGPAQLSRMQEQNEQRQFQTEQRQKAQEEAPKQQAQAVKRADAERLKLRKYEDARAREGIETERQALAGVDTFELDRLRRQILTDPGSASYAKRRAVEQEFEFRTTFQPQIKPSSDAGRLALRRAEDAAMPEANLMLRELERARWAELAQRGPRGQLVTQFGRQAEAERNLPVPGVDIEENLRILRGSGIAIDSPEFERKIALNVPTEPLREYIRQGGNIGDIFQPEVQAQFEAASRGLPGILGKTPLLEAALGETQTEGLLPGVVQFGTSSLTPTPVTEAIRDVPYLGPPLSRAVEYGTTVPALATMGVGGLGAGLLGTPAQNLAALGGGVVAGTAGEFAEQELGAPEGTSEVSELLGLLRGTRYAQLGKDVLTKRPPAGVTRRISVKVQNVAEAADIIKAAKKEGFEASFTAATNTVVLRPKKLTLPQELKLLRGTARAISRQAERQTAGGGFVVRATKNSNNAGNGIRELTTGVKSELGPDLLKWRPKGDDAHIITVNVPPQARAQGRASSLMSQALDDIQAQTAARRVTADVETPEGADLLSRFGATFEDQGGRPITLAQAKTKANRGAVGIIDLTQPRVRPEAPTGARAILAGEAGGTRVSGPEEPPRPLGGEPPTGSPVPPREPPVPPAPQKPGGPPGLASDFPAPTLDRWRTLERAQILRPGEAQPKRRIGELLARVPGAKPVIQTVFTPASLARHDPVLRVRTVYSLLEKEQAAHANATLARLGGTPLTPSRVPGMVRLLDGTEAAQREVTENISKYIDDLSPEQVQRVREQYALSDVLADQFEAAAGRPIRAKGVPREHYFPSVTLDDEGRAFVKRPVGAKQSPQHQRVIETQEELIAQGVSYSTPEEAFTLHVRAMQKATRDALLKKLIIEDKIGRTFKEGHEQAIRKLREELAAAPAGTPDELAAAKRVLERLERLRAAKENILRPRRGEYTGFGIGPGLSNVVFPKQSYFQLRKSFAPGQRWLKPVEMIAAVPRLIVTGAMDVGQWFLQGQTLLVKPNVWARSVAHSMEAIVRPANYRRWVENAPEARLAQAHGIDLAAGTEFTEAIRPSGLIGQVGRVPVMGPVITYIPKAAARGFDAFFGAARAIDFAAMMKLGIEPQSDEALRLARYVETKLGVPDIASLGVSTSQRQVENAFGLYSARYTRSIWSLPTYMFERGVIGADARKAMAGMLASGVLAYVGFAKLAGLKDEEIAKRLNPLSGSRFMSIPIGGNEIGFGGGFRAALVLLTTMTQLDDWRSETRNPIVNYVRSRTSPVTGNLYDYLTGTDATGHPADIEELLRDPNAWRKLAERNLEPQVLQALAQARGEADDKALAAVAAGLGGRTFPRNIYNIVAQERYGKDYRDLDNPALEKAVRDDPRVKSETDKEPPDKYDRLQSALSEFDNFATLNGERIGRTLSTQDQDNQLKETGQIDPHEWIDRYRDRQQDRSTISSSGRYALELKDKTAKSAAEKVVEKYFDIDPGDFLDQTGEPVWEHYFTAKDATYRAAVAVDRALGPFLRPPAKDEIVQSFREASQVRSDLFNKTPKYRGVSVADGRKIDKFISAVKEVARNSPKPEAQIAFEQAERINSPNLYTWYRILSSPRGRFAYISEEWDAYLVKNRVVLEEWYPDLYTDVTERRIQSREPEEQRSTPRDRSQFELVAP